MDRHDTSFWTHRHAIAAIALMLLLSIFIAAFASRWISDSIGDGDLAELIYLPLLMYVSAGSVVFGIRIEGNRAQSLSAGFLSLWLVRLWLWPLFLLFEVRRNRDLE